MNPNNLIIEDFDFLQYPIAQTYQLGGKTVIQISEPKVERSRAELLREVDDLKSEVSGLETDVEDLENEVEDTKRKRDELDDQIDSAFSLLADHFDYFPDYSETIGWNITSLKNFLNNKARSDAEWEELEEKISGLELDNRALCDTVEKLLKNQTFESATL